VAAPPATGASALFGQSERLVVDRNYAARKGFDAGFLAGLTLDPASFLKPREAEIAALLDGRSGLAARLDYEHFSLFMSAPRKLAFLTATNIDAEHYIVIDRDTGLPKVGPEGDTWVDDPRLATQARVGQDFYSDWSSLFDRGHLTRRTDPTWGTPEQAVRANADTFHRTNCSPQHFRFNESIRYWQGVERYVLEFGALQDKRRVSVFTGPVLNEDSQDFGGLAVPLQFWKLVVRIDRKGKPQATALVVDQRRLLGEKRVPIKPGGDGQAPDVSEYRVSVAHLETLTGLDFSALRAFDSYRAPAALSGAEASAARVISDWSDLL
jgi:endonuclease G